MVTTEVQERRGESGLTPTQIYERELSLRRPITLEAVVAQNPISNPQPQPTLQFEQEEHAPFVSHSDALHEKLVSVCRVLNIAKSYIQFDKQVRSQFGDDVIALALEQIDKSSARMLFEANKPKVSDELVNDGLKKRSREE